MPRIRKLKSNLKKRFNLRDFLPNFFGQDERLKNGWWLGEFSITKQLIVKGFPPSRREQLSPSTHIYQTRSYICTGGFKIVPKSLPNFFHIFPFYNNWPMLWFLIPFSFKPVSMLLLTLVYMVPSLKPVSYWWKTMVTASNSASVKGFTLKNIVNFHRYNTT